MVQDFVQPSTVWNTRSFFPCVMSFGGQLQLKPNKQQAFKKSWCFGYNLKTDTKAWHKIFGNKNPLAYRADTAWSTTCQHRWSCQKPGEKNLSYESLGPGSRYKLGCNPYKWPKIMGLAEKFGGIWGEFFQQNLVMSFQESSSCLSLFLIIL